LKPSIPKPLTHPPTPPPTHTTHTLQAWDTLTWFAALIAMAAYLNKLGFIGWFSSQVVGLVGGLGLSWQAALGLITGLYFYSHYFFASGAAHIGAMYTAFLSVAVACGAPGLVAALALGQLSNVMGCLTTYGIGSAPPYYGAPGLWVGRRDALPIIITMY
jgi:di/tricarboxylate transporter